MTAIVSPRRALALLACCALSPLAQATVSPVVTWNKAALVEVRVNSRVGPPVMARSLAVAHTCIYDAWVPYDTRAIAAHATSIPRRPVAEATTANKAKAISYAAYRCLLNLFPNNDGRLQAVMQSLGYDPGDTSTNLATPQGIGNAAAAAVIAARRNDGSNQYGDLGNSNKYGDYTAYAPRNAPMPFCLPNLPGTCNINVADPYHWQPLTADSGAVQRFIAPQWERVTPFALTSATQYDNDPLVAAGPNYLQSPQRFQADIDLILQNSAALTLQRKLLVEYWADGPDSELPPGHWGLFAQHVSQRDANSIDKDAKMFFAMHNASFDAGIVAWHLKRKYDGVRPITAVRYFKQGQQVLAWGGPGRPVELIDGGKWTPYNPGSNLTPAFPGYVSGHSIFSASSAAVLRAFTGSDNFGYSTVIPAGFGRVEPNVPPVPTTLSYATFTAAANDAAASRLTSGIHFADDNTVGLALGDLIGRQAWAKAQFLFDGGLVAGGSTAASAGLTSSLSFSHTVDAVSNRLLVVGVATTDGSNAARSVHYAGRPLTRLAYQNGPGNDNRAELWYLVAPPAGTATVTVSTTGWNDLVAGATNYSGVHQAQPFGITRAGAGSSARACVTLANESAPLAVTMLAVNADAGGVGAGSGQPLRWARQSDQSLLNLLAFTDVIGASTAGSAGPTASLCTNVSNARNWALLGVPLKPALQP